MELTIDKTNEQGNVVFFVMDGSRTASGPHSNADAAWLKAEIIAKAEAKRTGGKAIYTTATNEPRAAWIVRNA